MKVKFNGDFDKHSRAEIKKFAQSIKAESLAHGDTLCEDFSRNREYNLVFDSYDKVIAYK